MKIKTVAAGGTVLALLGAWFLSHQQRSVPQTRALSSDEAPPPQPPAQTLRAESEGRAVPEPEPEAQDPGGGPPVIEHLSVDKTEVCRGEDNFATVKARTLDGADYYLRIGMTEPEHGRFLQGTRIPFHLDRQPTHPLRVSVEGRRRTSFADLPEIHVKDCTVPRRVNIETTRTFDSPDRVRFDVTLVESPQPGSLDNAPFRALRYVWDFGDGQTATTSEPQASHSYEARSQSSMVSVYLVRVVLEEKGDRRVAGSVTVPLTNRGFVPLIHENKVLVSAGVVRKVDGDEPEKIWIYHGYSRAVSFDKVELIEQAPDGSKEEPTRRELAFASVLGLTTLPAGVSRELPPLDPAWIQPGRGRSLQLTGHTEDGKAAIGTIALTGSAPPVTARVEPPVEREDHRP